MRKLLNSIGSVEKLKQALLICLNEKEYGDITIAELAKRTRINRTTFYLFYGMKDELLIDLANSMMDKWFQTFFDLNMAKQLDRENMLFHQLLAWLEQWRPALKRILDIRTDSFDGFTLFTEGFEKRMATQKVFAATDEKTRKKYDLFIKIYSVGLASILKWWLDEGESFEAAEFHAIIERLRYRGYYSILTD